MKSFAWLGIGVFILLLAARWHDRFHNGHLRVLFFDVGQGDSTLVRFPHGQSLLIDGGGGWKDRNVGARELFLELTRLSVLRLNRVALSHPDQDHAYGLLGIFESFPVGEFWLNQFSWVPHPKPLLKTLVENAEERGAAIRPLATADRLMVDGVVIQRKPIHHSGPKSNNRPLVLILEYENCRLFFGGDMERAAETEFLPHLPPITVLKISHHGSRTSSTPPFIERAHPRMAVISVGRSNQYGHPHESVLARLWYRKIPIFRTDFHGFVEVDISPGGKLSCRNAMGACGTLTCRESSTSAPSGASLAP